MIIDDTSFAFTFKFSEPHVHLPSLNKYISLSTNTTGSYINKFKPTDLNEIFKNILNDFEMAIEKKESK